MPPAPKRPLTVIGAVVLLLLAAGFLALVWWNPWFLILVAAIFVGTVVFNIRERRRFRTFAAARHGESICSFARSFDYRAVDTRVIRAVYEELQAYFRGTWPAFPFRLRDRFEEDLHMDQEDLDDLVHDIANRAGRSMENTEQNPMYGNVKTVDDLIQFLGNQPRAKAA